MRAELVVKPLMGAFAEQIKVEIAQDRRKAVGVLKLDRVGAIPRAKAVVLGAVRQAAEEKSGVMNTRQYASSPFSSTTATLSDASGR